MVCEDEYHREREKMENKKERQKIRKKIFNTEKKVVLLKQKARSSSYPVRSTVHVHKLYAVSRLREGATA